MNIEQFIIDKLGIDKSEINERKLTRFFDEIDSFAFIDLIAQVENQFNIFVDLMDITFDQKASVNEVIEWFTQYAEN
ncbi:MULTISPECIES: acyl carrier protein [Vibrio]|jgi:acyl carrier protein|uniref:acyl carrier protein n=1 Tax=Vibrio TaxID=662 RepID=UPI00064887F9|nr:MULTISPECIES: acyl carrier protein [unclassified Vibrio]MCR9421051.1 acyl carrier protein [Vibrio sp. RM-69-4]